MVTSACGPRTAWHGCTLMVWSKNSQDSTRTPCGALTGVVRTPHGNLRTGHFSYPTGPVWGPWGTRKGAVRHPYRHVRELTQLEFAEIPYGQRMWPYGANTGPLRSPNGLFTGCLWSLMLQAHHAPGPRTGCSRAVLNKNRTSTHGCRTGLVRRRTNFAFPYGARRVLMHAL